MFGASVHCWFSENQVSKRANFSVWSSLIVTRNGKVNSTAYGTFNTETVFSFFVFNGAGRLRGVTHYLAMATVCRVTKAIPSGWLGTSSTCVLISSSRFFSLALYKSMAST